MLKKITVLLEMIKFKLTIFALPFAFMGAFLAGRGLPDWLTFFWVVLAMVGARTAAMGFNRIVDRHFDGANPRTAERALPVGAVTLVEAWSMVILASFMFFCGLLAVESSGPEYRSPGPGPDLFLLPDQSFHLVLPSGIGSGPGLFTTGRLGGGERESGRIPLGPVHWSPVLGGGL